MVLDGIRQSRKSVRLAAHLAAEMTYQHPDGCWWIELAPLTEPALVPYAMVRALGLTEEPGCSLYENLGSQLANVTAMVVVDNCEHLLDACAKLVLPLIAERTES